MTDKVLPPNLQEADTLLGELFEEVTKWEGTLAGGKRLDVGGAALESLFQTKVSFGNPRDNFIQLTEESFALAGVELNHIRQQQIGQTHDFYYMTVTVDMRPKPGAQFKRLCCELDFGPKGEDEPIVQAIFPKSKWRPVMTWGGGMSLGLNGNLTWEAGIDGAGAEVIEELPIELAARVANKNKLKSFIVVPDYAYEVGRFEIAAYGEGNSECYWYIQEPDLQKMVSVQFCIVFKVPKGTEAITLRGMAWAEPKMNWLIANLRHVFRDLSDKLQRLLRLKDKAAHKFARGAAEEWTLTLPRKS